MEKKEVLETIYKMLFKQKFANWYEGEFEDHLCGEQNCKSKEEILKDIEDLFNLSKK